MAVKHGFKSNWPSCCMLPTLLQLFEDNVTNEETEIKPDTELHVISLSLSFMKFWNLFK